ncbi:MAG: RNA methyltransferase [Deltaproteobacteria bacterium]|nr:RNA methyltransferase [Deltaproteobacteria bacterium]
MRPEVHLALVHHPVLNKEGRIVTTAVTNLDIHDNARSARTFGLASYHVVTPLGAQIELVGRILRHWREGFGARRVPTRVEAMNLVRVSRDLDEVVREVKAGREARPIMVATCARKRSGTTAFKEMRDRMAREPGPYVLLFGTGYGLSDEVLKAADALLEPIGDPSDWNHLSVRGAVAIVLDRLLGERG